MFAEHIPYQQFSSQHTDTYQMVSLFFQLSHDTKHNRLVLGNAVWRAHEKCESLRLHADKCRTVESKILVHTRETEGNQVGPISKFPAKKMGM